MASNEEAVGPVTVRERPCADHSRGQHLLARRDRADRVDERARRARAGAAPPRGSAPAGPPARRSPRAARASAGRGATAACPGRCTAGRPARGRTTPCAGGAAASPTTTSTLVAPIRVAISVERRGPRRARSTATISPSPPISAARWVVLPPGAAHRSSTRSPGCGSTTRATSIDAARLRQDRAAARTARSRRRRTGPRGRAPRAARGRAVARQLPPASVDRDERVDAQRALGRLVVGGQQRARLVGAEPVPPQLDDPQRVRVARSRRPPASSSLGQLDALALARAQDRVDEPAAGRSAWPARPTRRPPRGRRPRGTAAGRARAAARRARAARAGRARRCGDHPVERVAALDGAVGEAHRERRGRAARAPRLAVQRAVGVGALLEDAAEDGERARPRRGDHDPTAIARAGSRRTPSAARRPAGPRAARACPSSATRARRDAEERAVAAARRARRCAGAARARCARDLRGRRGRVERAVGGGDLLGVGDLRLVLLDERRLLVERAHEQRRRRAPRAARRACRSRRRRGSARPAPGRPARCRARRSGA